MSTAVLEWQSDLQLWTFCCCMSNECTCGSLIYQWLMTCYSGLHVGYVQWTMTDSRVVAVSQQTGLTESDAAKLLRGGWSIFLTYNFFSPKAYCLSPSCHYCHFTFAMQTLAAAFTKLIFLCLHPTWLEVSCTHASGRPETQHFMSMVMLLIYASLFSYVKSKLHPTMSNL